MSKITDDFKGEIPIGVDVDANIAEAREYSKTHGPVDTLKWLRNKIGNGKEWDYKQLDAKESKKENRPNKYEDFGNWHYGVITKSLGIPESVALSAAGGAQAAAHSG